VPPVKFKSLSWLYGSLIASTALAALMVIATIWFAALRHAEDDLVRHTLGVHNQIAQLLTLVQRAESGQRGYLLTGREMYLAPYEEAIEDLPGALDELGAVLVDNASQQQSVGRLRQLTLEKLRELYSTIDAREAGNPAAALAIVNNDSGQRMMDEVRVLIGTMHNQENTLLVQRQARAATFGILLQAGSATALLLICGAAVLGAFLTRRSFRELAAAHDRLVATNDQLTEQRNRSEAAESQLRQSQKMEAIGQLSGGIAHDFNNMLGVIAGSLDLTRRHIAKGDFSITRYLDSALAATKRSTALTHRLLAFARQQPLAPEPLDVNRMISTMSDLLRSTLGEQIRIETVKGGGLWLTKADGHQLESAILNIAINARDAMSDGGKLTIETANAYLDDAYARANPEVEAGQYVLIALSDTGAGMSAATLERAFDPFFTTKPVGTGTGLGLSQVFGFVKQSRGHIKIYSELDSGTTVKIYLPRFVGEAQAVAPAMAAAVRDGTTQKVVLLSKTIL
jgi:signal transduction histidine kinase